MGIAIDLTAILLPVVTVIFWIVQRRHERRNRSMELYRHYETDSMKRDRKEAWRLLREWEGAVQLSASGESPERLLVHKDELWSVLTFYLMLRRLVDAGHVDRRIISELFEDARSLWAEKLSSTISASLREPRMAHALEAIQISFGPTKRSRPTRRSQRRQPSIRNMPF